MALRNELREHVCRKDFRDRPEAEDRLTIRFGLVAGSRLSEPRDKGVFSTNHRDDETRCGRCNRRMNADPRSWPAPLRLPHLPCTDKAEPQLPERKLLYRRRGLVLPLVLIP